MALHGLAWELVALAAASSPPELSESSDSHLRLCRATSDRVGPNGAGLPRRGRPSETEGARHVHRRPGSSLPCRGRRGAREGLHGRPRAGGWDRDPYTVSITKYLPRNMVSRVSVGLILVASPKASGESTSEEGARARARPASGALVKRPPRRRHRSNVGNRERVCVCVCAEGWGDR